MKIPENKSCYRDSFKFDRLNIFKGCLNMGCKIIQIYMKQSMPIVLVFTCTPGELIFSILPETKNVGISE